MPRSLEELARQLETDKTGSHHYPPHYEAHFSALRETPVRLLEIGIGGYENPAAGGASLRMWKDFFPQGSIVGIDCYDKSSVREDRIVTCEGSQADESFLIEVDERHGPFDIIIDDGSHINSHVIRSFKVLFPRLSSPGIYVIEDLQTSYWSRHFGGSSRDLSSPSTSVGFLKTLIDGLNHVEFERPGYKPSYFDTHIVAMHFYHNLAFLYKGDYTEKSNGATNNVLLPALASL